MGRRRPSGTQHRLASRHSTEPSRADKGESQEPPHTREVICAAVTGTPARPTAVIAGPHVDDGRLVIAGRSTELSAAQSRQLAAVLRGAGPDHPGPTSSAPECSARAAPSPSSRPNHWSSRSAPTSLYKPDGSATRSAWSASAPTFFPATSSRCTSVNRCPVGAPQAHVRKEQRGRWPCPLSHTRQ